MDWLRLGWRVLPRRVRYVLSLGFAMGLVLGPIRPVFMWLWLETTRETTATIAPLVKSLLAGLAETLTR